MINFKRLFLYVLMVFLFSMSVHAQKRIKEKWKAFKVYGKLDIHKDSEDGSRITLLRNDEILEDNIARGNRFEYTLDFNYDYVLKFSKRGYITKKVYISTFVPQEVVKRDNRFPPLKFDITLFPKVKGVDYSVFDDPVSAVLFDKSIDDFDFDKEYNIEMEAKIKEIETRVLEKLESGEVEDEMSILYQELIARADKLFDVKSYIDSRSTYKEALNVKPREKYPKDRIALIDKILSDLAQKEQQNKTDEAYYELIKKADKLFTAENYIPSRSYYQEALTVNPKKQYPKDQIKIIDDILAKLSANAKIYAEAIAKADRNFREEKYTKARPLYVEALTYKENEQYPKDQINRIDQILKDKSIQAKKDRDYSETIAKADMLFNEKNYVDARLYYSKGLELKPEKQYPKDQITKIDNILANQKMKDDAYAKAIGQADQLYNQKKWNDAKSAYQNALSIKSFEQYPKEQMAKIDIKLKEIAENLSRDQAYNSAVEKADSHFNNEQWETAKSLYFEALKIKPKETYPPSQIEIIDNKLAALALKKKADDDYNLALKEADQYYNSRQWVPAKNSYQKALDIRNYEQYPKDQIAKIDIKRKEIADKLSRDKAYSLAIENADGHFNSEQWESAKSFYLEASKIKPNEDYPPSQIKIIDEKLAVLAIKKKTDDDYNAAIKEADQYFSNQQWLPAKNSYQKAIDIKNNEQYPKDQIAKIDIKRKEIAENLSRDKTYNLTIKNADSHFNNEQWESAKSFYLEASKIKPDETYPSSQIKIIDEKLTALANKKKADDDYRNTIKEADQNFNNQQWVAAKNSYQKALTIRNNEQYPKDQIRRIDKYLQDDANRKAEKAQYEELIISADNYFNKKDFENARKDYKAALVFQPMEEYPKTQIFHIDKLEKIHENETKNLKKIINKYEETIRIADQHFDKKEWAFAKHYYRKAISITPSEKYPYDRLAEIQRYFNLLADGKDNKRYFTLKPSKDDVRKRYNEWIATADSLLVKSQLSHAKSYYMKALGLNYNLNYPLKQIEGIDNQYKQSNNAKMKTAYTESIRKGNEAISRKNYAIARYHFRKARQTGVNNHIAEAKLKEIDESLIQDKKEQKQQKFGELLSEAENAASQKQYGLAKRYYQQAWEINPDAYYLQKKIVEMYQLLESPQ